VTGPAGPRPEPLELVHHHPGRLRVRASAFRVADEASRAVVAMLEQLTGIVTVEHATRTGSILVRYEPGLVEPDALLERIARAAELDLPVDSREARRLRASPAILAIDATRELNEAVHELTGFRADLRALAPAGLAALAAYAFAQQEGERLPRWDNLLYWSYNVFTALHRREIDAASAPKP